MTCPSCGHEVRSGARFCDQCGAALEAAPSAQAAERRQLTVLFCDLVGSTPLSQALDAEELRDALRAYQEACAEIIQGLDGHIAQYLGDGLLVYFGYPQAHEDDALRAVNAALAILDEVPALNARVGEQLPALREHPLQVRIAVHTGPVVVGEMGGGARREQLALGDTLNVAARLEGLAEPGWAVISDATRRLVQGAFVLEDLGARALKGVADAVRAHRVLRASGARSRLELAAATGLTPLVGRERETGLLLDRWRRAREGEGQAVLVVGEAGMGKSRLVQVLREKLAGTRHTWLEGRCSPYHQDSAFHGVIDLLEQSLGFARDDSPEQRIARLERALEPSGLPVGETLGLVAALLSVPLPARYPPPAASPEVLRRRTLGLLVAWLLALCERQPVVLVVEDLHWIDPSTLELLGMLLERAPAASLLMLLTQRPEFEAPWSGPAQPVRLVLQPLARKEIEAMVERIAGGKPLPALVLEQVVQKTDGVPLFVEELTKNVLESNLLRESDQRYERVDPLPPLAIPSTLQDSLMARLDRLGPAKEVAQLAAVLGREFPYELLAAASSLDAAFLARSVGELADAGLLHRRGDVHAFRHALIQETAYQSLLRSRRRELHARVALVLEERFPERVEAQPELVARHYEEAGRASQAIACYQRAGERATERSANEEAIRHLTRALALLSALPEGPERDQRELALRVALGNPLMAAKGYSSPEVAATYGRARELSQTIGEAPRLSQALFGLATFYSARGDLEPCIEVARQLLGLGERSGDASVLLAGHLAMGFPLYWRGEPGASLEHFERTMALYDPVEHRGLAYVYGQDPDLFSRSMAAWSLWLVGRPDQALRRAEENVELGRKSGHAFSLAFALAFGAVVHHLRREPARAGEWAEEAVALSEELGFPLPLGTAKVLLGWSLASPATAERALAEVQQGLAELAKAGTEVGGPYMIGLLAETHQGVGRLDDALGAAAVALAVSAQHHSPFWDAELHRLTGELLLQRDAAAVREAEQAFGRALETARGQGARSFELRCAVSLGRLWQVRGELDRARELVAPLYAGFSEGLDTPDLASARALLA